MSIVRLSSRPQRSRSGFRGADSPGGGCCLRRRAAFERTRGSTTRRPARQRRAAQLELVMTVIGRVTSQGASQPAGARVLGVPPPLYYGVAFAAGMLLRATTIPLALGAGPETVVVAVVLLVSG